jgi:type I restriction enzyme M protein
MAKQKIAIKEKLIEVTLWDAANKLRGSVEQAEYKHVVLEMIFLKFANDKFEYHRDKLILDKKGKHIEFVNPYENIGFEEKLNNLKSEFAELLMVEEQSKKVLLEVF